MAITTNDEEMLKRLLGCDSIPEKVQHEAEIRTSLYHRSGANGPLGTMALIELIRFCGCEVSLPKPTVASVDWSRYPQNGTIRVEAYFFKSWLPGVYKARGDHGMIHVLLDDDNYVRECRPEYVRLASQVVSPSPVPPEPPEPSEPDIADKMSVGTQTCEYDEPATPEPIPLTALRPPETDWSAVQEGRAVWFEDDGTDIVDAKFMGVAGAEKGVIYVQVDGEDSPKPVSTARVTLAG